MEDMADKLPPELWWEILQKVSVSKQARLAPFCEKFKTVTGPAVRYWGEKVKLARQRCRHIPAKMRKGRTLNDVIKKAKLVNDEELISECEIFLDMTGRDSSWWTQDKVLRFFKGRFIPKPVMY